MELSSRELRRRWAEAAAAVARARTIGIVARVERERARAEILRSRLLRARRQSAILAPRQRLGGGRGMIGSS